MAVRANITVVSSEAADITTERERGKKIQAVID